MVQKLNKTDWLDNLLVQHLLSLQSRDLIHVDVFVSIVVIPPARKHFRELTRAGTDYSGWVTHLVLGIMYTTVMWQHWWMYGHVSMYNNGGAFCLPVILLPAVIKRLLFCNRNCIIDTVDL